MSNAERNFVEILSGRKTGIVPSLLRGATATVEPFYSVAMRVRNRLYDRQLLRTHHVDRPVVGIGNITTGGTGKTPAVHWLADALRTGGNRPAVLMRGYGAERGKPSDEQQLLADLLTDPTRPPVTVHADPDRVRGAREIYGKDPSINVILLDDGFQHRRLARDFDMVLIDATSPFGFGHVLPRGLLREPLAGLRRADAILLTRTDQVEESEIQDIYDVVRLHNPPVPIYRSSHAPAFLFDAAGVQVPLAILGGKSVLAVSGIGNPAAFTDTLHSLGANIGGTSLFPDHHPYSPNDVAAIHDAAGELNATQIVTTEKDWVKLQSLAGVDDILRLCIRLRFREGDEQRLLEQVTRTIFPT